MFKEIVLTFAILGSAMGLSGCSTIKEVYTDYPKQVAVMQGTLTLAEHTAYQYAKLTPCAKTSSPICRDPLITAKIGTYDEMAFQTIEAARAVEDQTKLEAAQTALNALTTITNSLPVK